MFSKYLEDWENKPGYYKELVSLWSGWLGKDNIGLLDKVTENEWAKFNDWIRNLASDFEIVILDFETKAEQPISNIEEVLSDYKTSMNKDSSQFIELGIPALGCVISEEWDYTYIIWHQKNGAVEELIPYIKKAGLKHFHD